jgi:hypothetical protein
MRSRKRCSPTGEAWGGGGRGAMSGSARSGGARSGVAGLIGVREVGRVAQGRTGGVGGWLVGRAGFGWSVGPLDLGDGSLVHHPR